MELPNIKRIEFVPDRDNTRYYIEGDLRVVNLFKTDWIASYDSEKIIGLHRISVLESIILEDFND